jgi:hypothetical protein
MNGSMKLSVKKYLTKIYIPGICLARQKQQTSKTSKKNLFAVFEVFVVQIPAQ